MKNTIIVLAVISILLALFIAIDSKPVQAQETYIQWFPMIYVNYRPQRVGCELPDDAACTYGPPFSTPNLTP